MADADLWPPAPFDVAAIRWDEHDAWVTGDTAKLNEIYSGKGAVATHVHDGVPYRGGVIGAISKMWWGQPIVADEQRSMMHLPIAADLVTLSADLLFSEAPKIRYTRPDGEADAAQVVDGQPVDAVQEPKRAAKWVHPGQQRLDEIMASDKTHAELLKSGEFSATHGGAYLAVVWDTKLMDRVWIRAYAEDCGIPTFRYGELTSVTLWTEYRDPGSSDVFRLLEIHNPGTITYALHKGGDRFLGATVPLGTRAETATYEALRTEAELEAIAANPALYTNEVTVATGVDRLAVVYYPNMLPQRDWRKIGGLADLGRSDLAGKEDILDKIDQAWSSLLRDMDNGLGRIIMPEQYLEQGKRGEGAKADMRRQVYVGIDAIGRSDEGLSSQITLSQFVIRVEEHLQIVEALIRRLANACGYSASHLGIDDGNGVRTATEITADFTDSERTRDKKALYVKPALARLAQVALAIDAQVFPGKGGKFYEELPEIEFPAVSQQDMEKLARAQQSFRTVGVLSVREAVKQQHPDWDNDQIDDEVDELLREARQTIAARPEIDPATFNGDDPADPQGADQQQGDGHDEQQQ